MDFINIISGYVVIIVAAICFCVGYVLKNIVPSEKVNKFIPLIMAVLGVVLNVWLNEFSFTPEILLGGLASGLASTGVYEGIKGIKEFIEVIKNIKPPS
jgi:hypothetical protein